MRKAAKDISLVLGNVKNVKVLDLSDLAGFNPEKQKAVMQEVADFIGFTPGALTLPSGRHHSSNCNSGIEVPTCQDIRNAYKRYSQDEDNEELFGLLGEYNVSFEPFPDPCSIPYDN